MEKEIVKNKKVKPETKQEVLNLEDHVQHIEQQLKDGFEGHITEINEVSNTVFFKGAGSFDERMGYAVTVTCSDPDNTEFTQWFSKPNMRGWEKSNMYGFKSRYGSVPKTGMRVSVFVDDDGFFRIKI